MNGREYKNLQEAYYSIYEALTDQSELDNLRKAAAQATMAGPSKEAQALMSDRAKRMLGADKLKAGIAGQERVQRMMRGIPEPKPATTTAAKPGAAPVAAKPGATLKKAQEAPKPQLSAKAQAILSGQSVFNRDPRARGGFDPRFDKKPAPTPAANLPSKTVIQPTDWGSMKSPVSSQTPTTPQAPKSPVSSQTPTTPQAPKAPVPDRSKDYQRAWDNRNNPFAKGKIRNTWSKMSPEEKAAAKEWAKTNNKNWQEMGLPEQRDIYDEVLGYLLSEGYSEEESNLIMVELINENRLKSLVKGIQGVAKFVQKRASTPLRTAATDTSAAALLVPPATPTIAGKITTAAVSSPTPIVRTIKSPSSRTAPKGANKITSNVWNEPSAPSSRINPSRPSGPEITSTRALTGTPSRPALPSGGKTTVSAKPQFKPEALPKPNPTVERGGALATTRGPKPQFKPEALPKTQATVERGGALATTRGPKPQFKPEALPSAKTTLWSKVQQATQPQKQLSAAKKTQSSDSQLWKKLNKTAERSVDYQASQKPAPEPQWRVAPKLSSKNTVSKEIKVPGGRPRPKVSDLAKYAAPLATAVALSQLKGDTEKKKTKEDKSKSEQGVGVIPRVAKPYVPERPKGTETRKNPPTEETPSSSSVGKSKITPKVKGPVNLPTDPDLERYHELRKTDPVKAKELGMKIWTKKYKPAFSQPDIA